MLISFALAGRALRRNLARATLTITGLLIGVAAVMMVTGLSTGAREFIGRRLKSLGTNLIIVLPRSTASSGVRGAAARLTEDDGEAIATEGASITGVAPMVVRRAVMTYGERSVTSTIVGTTAKFFPLRDWPVSRGEIWTPTEELTKGKVCVIGTTVARQLFAGEDPVGHTIRVGRHPYRVTGLLTSKGTSIDNKDLDDRVVMPIGSARTRFARGATGSVDVLVVGASSPRSAARAASQVEGILRQRHHRTERDADFEVFSQQRLLDVQQLVFDALTGFLVLVAAVSLLVGGIGVMNIMLVSVTERTREIGIRLAVGATRADVLTQFVVEAAALALIGGVLGVLVGVGGTAAFGFALGWPMQVPPAAIISGVAVSALTGVAFGFLPARQASRLDPIEALRHE
jgi:putative ABC transport system permease protein